tara:strand:+ start:334 stop:474 length:141 start_codon:yes stop_codon:yes gene_type:complete
MLPRTFSWRQKVKTGESKWIIHGKENAMEKHLFFFVQSMGEFNLTQ